MSAETSSSQYQGLSLLETVNDRCFSAELLMFPQNIFKSVFDFLKAYKQDSMLDSIKKRTLQVPNFRESNNNWFVEMSRAMNGGAIL